MMGNVETRLVTAQIVVPDAPMPAGNYVPYVVSRGHVFVSGQTCKVKGQVAYKGMVGRELSLEDGRFAAPFAPSICSRS